MNAEELVWGTGYGARRHLPSGDDPNRSLCSSPAMPSRLDFFSDDTGPYLYGFGRVTTREIVMRRSPCARCAKKAGVEL